MLLDEQVARAISSYLGITKINVRLFVCETTIVLKNINYCNKKGLNLLILTLR